MISVCMATYNGGKYIDKQLSSILKQLDENDEIIISDDGSKDGTLDIINSFKDKRIHVFNNNGRQGVVPNFENALTHAKGDIIILSDQDDVWADNKVSVIKEKLKNVDLVVHNSLLMDAKGNISDVDFFSLRHSGSGYLKNLYKNTFVGSCMAFKSILLKQVLPFPKHILWHDMWIGLMAEKHRKTLFIPDCLLYYRRHGDNASATSEKSSFSIWKMISYRFWMMYYTFVR